jgi:hypothetical protein
MVNRKIASNFGIHVCEAAAILLGITGLVGRIGNMAGAAIVRSALG